MEAQRERRIFVMFGAELPGAEGAAGEDFGGGDEEEAGAMSDEAFDGHERVVFRLVQRMATSFTTRSAAADN